VRDQRPYLIVEAGGGFNREGSTVEGLIVGDALPVGKQPPEHEQNRGYP
jgi:hypothetical protein